jgi:CHAT domain-containing protein
LPPLPGAAREAERVAALFTRGEARIGARATESALESARTASVVHIAAHAIVDPSAMGETALLLAGSAHDDGILRPQEIARLSLAADLVVLSACRTTRSDMRFGDEGFRGLVTPLFEAGARSVVATAWPVDDARQLALVERFYGELARGLTVGAALRAARLASMRAGDSPREWAALVLWGDATVRPAARMRSRASRR